MYISVRYNWICSDDKNPRKGNLLDLFSTLYLRRLSWLWHVMITMLLSLSEFELQSTKWIKNVIFYFTGWNDRGCLLRSMWFASKHKDTRSTNSLDGVENDTDLLSAFNSRWQTHKSKEVSLLIGIFNGDRNIDCSSFQLTQMTHTYLLVGIIKFPVGRATKSIYVCFYLWWDKLGLLRQPISLNIISLRYPGKIYTSGSIFNWRQL